MFKGMSQCMLTVGMLYFGLSNPIPLLSLNPLPPIPHFLTAFNTHPYILYLHILCDIIDAISFFFTFALSQSFIEYFHYYKHVLHLSLYNIILAFVLCLLFGTLFYIWQKTCSFWVSKLALLHNKMSSNYIHLPSNRMPLFLMTE
jgi:hypothetical protein